MTPKTEGLWTKFENHARNEGLTQCRINKLKMCYRFIERYLDFQKAGRDDIEGFINDLNNNKIKNRSGQNLAGNTKQDIKKFLKQFYKWFKGDNEYYPKEVSWIKTSIAKDERPEEKPIIELRDVPKLANMFRKYDYQMAVLIQFDSGFRIQELMSVKKRDLAWEEFDDGKKCWWIKCNVSKTFPRKIPIPLFSEEVSAFANSPTFKSKNDDDSLFDINYTRYTNSLREHSIKLFGVDAKTGKPNKVLTSHCLRHSSATYYAGEYSGNVPLLAQRYGWSFDARELKIYVRTSGAYNKQGAKISYKNELSELKAQNEGLTERLEAVEKKLQLLLGKASREDILAAIELKKAKR